MPQRLQVEIAHLKDQILSLGSEVEDRVRRAVRSIHKMDLSLAEDIIQEDIHIDEMEVDLEEECLKILALHQPLAGDLRLIIAILKINNDLERIGDLAVNIAERARALIPYTPFEFPFDFATMSEHTQEMLRKSLDALVHLEADTAYWVCSEDQVVDDINREMYRITQQQVKEDPDRIEYLTHLMGVSRHLERIADHATNISEDIIYLIQGDIVRHHTTEFHPLSGNAPDRTSHE